MTAWQILPAQQEFAAFASEWDHLNHTLFSGHPFFDSRFIGPLLEHFGDGREQLCVHRTNGGVDGALILRSLGMGRWALFLPAQAQAGAVLLDDARPLESLLPSLPGYAWSLDLLSLDPLYGPRWADLRLPRTVTAHALTMAVATKDGFDHYWQARPRNLAKNMRRYRRRAEEQSGSLAVNTITEPSQLRNALARYGAMEAGGWKGGEGTAITIENVQGRFYEKTLHEFAATGQAMVMELHIGERLAASRLFILNDHVWIILKTTYDEALAALAPGRQLLQEVLRKAFADLNGGSVEFYTNATRDQSEWATSLRYIPHHQIFRNSPVAAIYGIARTLRRGGAQPARQAEDGKPPRFDPREVTACELIANLPPEAVHLMDDSAGNAVDCTAGWFRNLQETAFAGEAGVRYYVMNFDGRPVAVLPLRRTSRGPVRAILSLSNYYTSLFAPALAPGASALDLVPLLQAADRELGSGHVMRFFPMDPAAPAFECLLTALRSAGWIPFRYFCFGNWFLPVRAFWSQYLAGREGKLRSTLRRMSRKFLAEGGTLEIVADGAAIEPAIQAFKDVYAMSWKKPEPFSEFVPGLMRWLAARGELRLGIARLGDRPVAAQLWIVRQGKASIFKLAHDESFSVLSPGTLLTAHLMERVIDRDGVTEVDYLIGDDPYKQSWMSHRRERWGIVAYNPRTVIGLFLLAREVAGRLLRRFISLRHPACRPGESLPRSAHVLD